MVGGDRLDVDDCYMGAVLQKVEFGMAYWVPEQLDE